MSAKEKEEQAEEVSVLDKPDIIMESIGYKSKKIKLERRVELADWVRKVTITIDDKNDNDPISVVFEGEWSGRDLNLASKSLLLEYGVYVRNR
jgi:hypothetical protein